MNTVFVLDRLNALIRDVRESFAAECKPWERPADGLTVEEADAKMQAVNDGSGFCIGFELSRYTKGGQPRVKFTIHDFSLEGEGGLRHRVFQGETLKEVLNACLVAHQAKLEGTNPNPVEAVDTVLATPVPF